MKNMGTRTPIAFVSLSKSQKQKPKLKRIKAGACTIAFPSGKTSKARTKRMTFREKIQLAAFGLALLVAALTGAELSVSKREVHSHGTINKIDVNSHALSFTKSGESSPTIIYWNQETGFEMDGVRVEPSILHPSMKVIVWEKNSLIFPERATKITVSTPRTEETRGESI